MSATVIVKNDRCSGEYDMFEVRSVDGNGALLAGPLLLEVGELIRLRVDKGDTKLEVEARVDSIDEQGLRVLFVDVSDEDRDMLAR